MFDFFAGIGLASMCPELGVSIRWVCRSMVGVVSSATHWEALYGGRASEDLGWYEPRPSTLDLVLRFSGPADAVIDVGAGDSRLVDELLHLGYEQVTVLDLSETALYRARPRLGPMAGNASWICADVTALRACGARKACRGCSGGVFVLVDESVALGCSEHRDGRSRCG